MQLPNEIKKLYPFESRWMDVQGHKLHYIDEGEREFGKPVVLLLHGNPTWSFLYREVIPKLRPACRVIALDYIGMGLSDKPPIESFYTLSNHTKILAEFIAKLGLRNCYLVAQDWGGPIGLGYAVENPKKIKGALLMNTWAWPEPSAFHAAVAPWRMMHAPLVGAHFFLRRNALVERGIYLSVNSREKFKAFSPVLQAYRLPFSSPMSRVATLAFPRNIPLAEGDLNWARMRRIEDGLREATFPTRLIWGAKDQVFPPENAHRFKSLLQNCSEPRIIAEGDHFLPEDAPAEIAEEIMILIGKKAAA